MDSGYKLKVSGNGFGLLGQELSLDGTLVNGFTSGYLELVLLSNTFKKCKDEGTKVKVSGKFKRTALKNYLTEYAAFAPLTGKQCLEILDEVLIFPHEKR